MVNKFQQNLASATNLQERGSAISKEWNSLERQEVKLFNKSVEVGFIFGEFVVNNKITPKTAKQFGLNIRKNVKVILSKVRTLFNNKELAEKIIKDNPNIKSFETLSKRISAELNKNNKKADKPLAIEDKSSTVEQSSSTEEVKTKQVSAFDIAFEAIAKADSLGITREELIQAFKENLTLLDEENNQREVA